MIAFILLILVGYTEAVRQTRGTLIPAEVATGCTRSPSTRAALLRAVRAGAFAAGVAAAVVAAPGATADDQDTEDADTVGAQARARNTRPRMSTSASSSTAAAAPPGIGVDTLGVRRASAPPRRRYTKGTLQKARKMFRSSAARQRGITTFLAERFAPSTRQTRSSRMRTLRTLIRDAGCATLPVTADGMYAVAAALKRGGYRTGRAYLGIWEAMHRERGHAWTDDLRQAKSWATASLQRGLGPAVPAATFDIEKWAATCPETDDADMIIVGTFWLMRGAELAAILVEQARTGPGARIATIELGAHKTNTAGAICERALRCTCGQGAVQAGGGSVALGTAICPTHALWRVLQRRACRDPADGTAGKRPLFPGRAGRARSDADLREAIRAATATTGTSEHTLRRTGAQFYARRGVQLAVIQHLGRWGSQTIERYVGEALSGRSSWAPLAAAGDLDAGRMVAGCGLPGPAHTSLASLTGLVASLVARDVDRAVRAHAAPVQVAAPSGGTGDTNFVVSRRSGVGHLVRAAGGGSGQCACGWQFGPDAAVACTAEDVTCQRCIGFLASAGTTRRRDGGA